MNKKTVPGQITSMNKFATSIESRLDIRAGVDRIRRRCTAISALLLAAVCPGTVAANADVPPDF
jgi:hypothetical protein